MEFVVTVPSKPEDDDRGPEMVPLYDDRVPRLVHVDYTPPEPPPFIVFEEGWDLDDEKPN